MSINRHKKLDFYWPLVGNQAARDFLDKAIASGKTASAYAFIGPDGVGKSAAARYFSYNLLVKHNPALADIDPERLELSGDVSVTERLPEKQLISIEQVRGLISRLELGSFSNSYKIGIIKGGENLSEGAANALLKTLEEPRIKVVVIIIADRLESLLPTIRSRVQVLDFQASSRNDIYDYLSKVKGLSPDLAKKCSSLALGRPALALKFSENLVYLEAYEKLALNVYDLFSNDSETRFTATEALAKALEDRLTSFSLEDILLSAESWLRDCLLARCEAPEWWRHGSLREELEALSSRPDFNLSQIAERSHVVSQAKDYAKSHFSPKTVLEYLAINL